MHFLITLRENHLVEDFISRRVLSLSHLDLQTCNVAQEEYLRGSFGSNKHLLNYFNLNHVSCFQGFCLTPFHPDNTAGIVTKRNGFRRRLQEIYLVPVVIDDNGYPPKSSTGTLTVRVCGCESNGSLLTCSAEAIFLPVGLSTGALVAILLCIIILLGENFCFWEHPLVQQLGCLWS